MPKFIAPIVDKEFLNLFPVPTKAERAGLFKSISVEGVRDSLVVWEEQNILLDGHTRYGIATELGIEYGVTYLSFPGRHEAKEWILRNQLDRRNLMDERRKFFIGMLMAMQKKAAGAPIVTNSDNLAELSKAQESEAETAKRIAAEQGVSARTVYRSQKFTIAVNLIGSVKPNLKKLILDGKSGMTEAEVIAAAPQSCERCWRLGPPPPNNPCPQCADLRAGRRAPKPKPTRKERHEVEVINGILNKLKAIDRAAKLLITGSEFSDHVKVAARKLDLAFKTAQVQPDPLVHKFKTAVEWPAMDRLLELFRKVQEEVRNA